jgi:hypothetical protein
MKYSLMSYTTRSVNLHCNILLLAYTACIVIDRYGRFSSLIFLVVKL